MDIKIFREYRLKFYLNARHYIIVGNEKSDTHPHTWDLALTILIRKKEFIKFGNFETKIEEYFSKYQDRVLNEIAPFNAIIPTLENMVDYFANDIYKIILKARWEAKKYKVTIFDKEQNDVTKNYKIHIVYGTLILTP